MTVQKIFPCFEFFSDIPQELYMQRYWQINTSEFVIDSNIYRSDLEISKMLSYWQIYDLHIVRNDLTPSQVEPKKPKFVYRMNYLSELKVYEIFFQNTDLTIQGRFTPTEFEAYLYPMISTMLNRTILINII